MKTLDLQKWRELLVHGYRTRKDGGKDLIFNMRDGVPTGTTVEDHIDALFKIADERTGMENIEWLEVWQRIA